MNLQACKCRRRVSTKFMFYFDRKLCLIVQMFWTDTTGDLEINNRGHSVTSKDKKKEKAILKAYYRKILDGNVFLWTQSKSLTVGSCDCKQVDIASIVCMLYSWLQGKPIVRYSLTTLISVLVIRAFSSFIVFKYGVLMPIKKDGFTGSYKNVNGFQSSRKKRREILDIKITWVGMYSLYNHKRNLLWAKE